MANATRPRAARLGAIEAEVRARVGRPEPAALETIREAVADALAGRRPQW
jgi:hypothetical protein